MEITIHNVTVDDIVNSCKTVEIMRRDKTCYLVGSCLIKDLVVTSFSSEYDNLTKLRHQIELANDYKKTIVRGGDK